MMTARRCDALPQHRGLPVPHVALWEAEQPSGAMRVGDLERDPQGVRWWATPQRIGQGQPLFAALHPFRQRDTLLQGRCQVCNTPATSWLLEAALAGSSTVRTTLSPVCAECEPVARARCPHLVANPPLRASTTTPPRLAGYLGRLLGPDNTSQEAVLDLDDPRLSHFVAVQAVADLVDLVWD